MWWLNGVNTFLFHVSIPSCTWDGVPCSNTSFTTAITDQGLCYTFNSDRKYAYDTSKTGRQHDSLPLDIFGTSDTDMRQSTGLITQFLVMSRLAQNHGITWTNIDLLNMSNKLSWILNNKQKFVFKRCHLQNVQAIRNHFTCRDLLLIPAWISNHMPSKTWDEITFPFRISAVQSLKFENWFNVIPHFMMDLITYPCWD